jgi:hypothetical protein
LRGATVTSKDRLVTSPDGHSTYPGVVPVVPQLSGARRALVDFAERSPASQADIDQVMRALVSHDDWYLPVSFADRVWGQSRYERELIFADLEPTRVLNVFTDHESALLADGQPIGVYGGPVSGVRLMRALDDHVEALIVNPASPREHQWFIASPGFPIAAAWATAIGVERALAGRANGPVPAAELLGHRYHLLLEKSTHGLAQIYLPDIDGAVAVCFTASDRVDEFVSSLPVAARPLADLAEVDGPQLFDMMHGVGAAGLVINAGSDDQTALTREDIADITAARSVPL